MKKTILIIGGGIAGLTAAFYALKNNFNVKIYEKNKYPGGYCVSWIRKGFTIFTGIHAVVGIKEKKQYYDLWKELGVINNMNFKVHDIFEHFEIYNKDNGTYEKIEFDSDLNKLKEYLIKHSPEDKKIINRIIKASLKLSLANIILENEPRINNLSAKIKSIISILPVLPILIKWKNTTVRQISVFFLCYFYFPMLIAEI